MDHTNNNNNNWDVERNRRFVESLSQIEKSVSLCSLCEQELKFSSQRSSNFVPSLPLSLSTSYESAVTSFGVESEEKMHSVAERKVDRRNIPLYLEKEVFPIFELRGTTSVQMPVIPENDCPKSFLEPSPNPAKRNDGKKRLSPKCSSKKFMEKDFSSASYDFFNRDRETLVANPCVSAEQNAIYDLWEDNRNSKTNGEYSREYFIDEDRWLSEEPIKLITEGEDFPFARYDFFHRETEISNPDVSVKMQSDIYDSREKNRNSNVEYSGRDLADKNERPLVEQPIRLITERKEKEIAKPEVSVKKSDIYDSREKNRNSNVEYSGRDLADKNERPLVEQPIRLITERKEKEIAKPEVSVKKSDIYDSREKNRNSNVEYSGRDLADKNERSLVEQPIRLITERKEKEIAKPEVSVKKSDIYDSREKNRNSNVEYSGRDLADKNERPLVEQPIRLITERKEKEIAKPEVSVKKSDIYDSREKNRNSNIEYSGRDLADKNERSLVEQPIRLITERKVKEIAEPEVSMKKSDIYDSREKNRNSNVEYSGRDLADKNERPLVEQPIRLITETKEMEIAKPEVSVKKSDIYDSREKNRNSNVEYSGRDLADKNERLLVEQPIRLITERKVKEIAEPEVSMKQSDIYDSREKNRNSNVEYSGRDLADKNERPLVEQPIRLITERKEKEIAKPEVSMKKSDIYDSREKNRNSNVEYSGRDLAVKNERQSVEQPIRLITESKDIASTSYDFFNQETRHYIDPITGELYSFQEENSTAKTASSQLPALLKIMEETFSQRRDGEEENNFADNANEDTAETVVEAPRIYRSDIADDAIPRKRAKSSVTEMPAPPETAERKQFLAREPISKIHEEEIPPKRPKIVDIVTLKTPIRFSSGKSYKTAVKDPSDLSSEKPSVEKATDREETPISPEIPIARKLTRVSEFRVNTEPKVGTQELTASSEKTRTAEVTSPKKRKRLSDSWNEIENAFPESRKKRARRSKNSLGLSPPFVNRLKDKVTTQRQCMNRTLANLKNLSSYMDQVRDTILIEDDSDKEYTVVHTKKAAGPQTKIVVTLGTQTADFVPNSLLPSRNPPRFSLDAGEPSTTLKLNRIADKGTDCVPISLLPSRNPPRFPLDDGESSTSLKSNGTASQTKDCAPNLPTKSPDASDCEIMEPEVARSRNSNKQSAIKVPKVRHRRRLLTIDRATARAYDAIHNATFEDYRGNKGK